MGHFWAGQRISFGMGKGLGGVFVTLVCQEIEDVQLLKQVEAKGIY